jgi:alpha-tubulin suppressor-like RCC1 family protein
VPAGPSVVQVSAGFGGACARLSDGHVRCWGENSQGSVGDGTTTNRDQAVEVSGLDDAASVSVGLLRTCAVRSNGRVACWGSAAGDGTTDAHLTPFDVPGISTAVAVSSFGSSCAVLADHTVTCWSGAAPSPTPVAGITDAVDVAVGYSHTCVLRTGGTVACWGEGSSGQLGNGSSVASATPVAVTGLSGVVELRAGGAFTCARLGGGSVRCWGAGTSGQLGNGASVDSNVAVTASGLAAASIAPGGTNACALGSAGAVSCWGSNESGELGTGVAGPSSPFPPAAPGSTVPTAATEVGSAVQVSVGSSGFACAVDAGGVVRCWGSDDWGQLGNGAAGASLTPAVVLGLS